MQNLVKRKKPFDIKGYIILGYNKDEDKYYGYVEKSFSMGISDRYTYFYHEGKYSDNDIKYYIKNNPNFPKFNSKNQFLYLLARADAEYLNKNKYGNLKWKAYRVKSKFCPVNVNTYYHVLYSINKIEYDKFFYRNVRFEEKK